MNRCGLDSVVGDYRRAAASTNRVIRKAVAGRAGVGDKVKIVNLRG